MSLPDSGRYLHGALEVAAQEDPDAPAVAFIGDATYSRAEPLESRLRLAAGFRAECLRPGSHECVGCRTSATGSELAKRVQRSEVPRVVDMSGWFRS